MRRAFTLLEILVATMLLAMLVTILTMIFNQSSIAWTVGMASLTDMGDMRRMDAAYSSMAESAIRREGPGGGLLAVTSVLSDGGNGISTETRTVAEITGTGTTNADEMDDDSTSSQTLPIGSGSAAQGRASYIVGVTSWGPDGQQGTWDDITSMPEEVVK